MLISFVLNFDALGESQVGAVSISAFLQSEATDVGGIADSKTQVFIPGEARSKAELGNTVYWDGIVSATDSFGDVFDHSQL